MFGSKYTSATLQKKRRRRAIRLFYFYLFLTLFALGLFSWAIRLDAINIKNIAVSGNSIESADELESFARLHMAGSYLFLVPKTSVFFYPKNKIENGLKENFPRLSYADLSFDGFDSVILEVKERNSDFIWCVNAESADCYFADREGFIFSKAPDFFGSVYLKVSGGLEGEPVGQIVSFSWNFDEFKAFLNSLKERSLSPRVVHFMEQGDLEIDLDKDRKIFINQKDALADILINLESVLESDIFQKSGYTFEYIDLRFENKVFYKLKN